MSKRVILALLAGYSIRAFQKGFFWKGVKNGASKSFLKILKEEFPEAYEASFGKLTDAQKADIQQKLRGI